MTEIEQRKEHRHKILMVHNYYQIPGGEDTVVANEKKLLEDHGHEVVLYSRHNNELKNIGKLQKLALPFTTVFNPRTYRDIKRIIKEHNIEVVHVHNTLNLISPSVYYAAVRMKASIVQTVHNFRFLCPGATFYRDGHICEECVSKGLNCAVKHKCYRNSRAQTLICVINTWIHRHTGILHKINYIALTEFNKKKLLQLKQIDTERVFVKPNFTFAPQRRKKVSNEQDYYLFVGRIEEIKGVRLLIEAFRRMPKKALLLAGQGPLQQELTVSENITFLGQVDHNKVLEIMAGAKAVILPSQIYEGFPMIVPEAFSLHIPVIVCNIGNNGVLIEDGKNGAKFEYNSVDSLIETIKRFEKMDHKLLSENAYQDYISFYSDKSNYELLWEIYESVYTSERG